MSQHEEWKTIHAHHTTPASIYLKEAKKHNRITIAHSHTAGGNVQIKSFIKSKLRSRISNHSDYLFACSKNAGEWMFGNDNNARVINNAIDVRKYTYSFPIRSKIRNKLGFTKDDFVVGHIGNFSAVKNYDFIIEVFSQVIKVNKNAKLILIGKDDNNPEIKSIVNKRDIKDNVLFTGVRSDIPDLLQAIDIFLFPSLYEGLPVTLIEAQASGLKILASDTITNEVAITDNVEFMSLNKSAKAWADIIMKYSDGYERKDTSQEILSASYDVKQIANELENFYIKILK